MDEQIWLTTASELSQKSVRNKGSELCCVNLQRKKELTIDAAFSTEKCHGAV